MLAYAEFVGGGDVRVAVDALTRAIGLDPRREEYRILLAQVLGHQGEYEKATALLGPVMAAGRTPEMRTEARRVLTDLVDRRARAAAAAAPPITTSAGPAAPTLLRVVQPGEQRVLGTLDAIDCVNGTIVLRVTSNGRTLSLTARQFADVEFVSFRSSAPGSVSCGPQKPGSRVYATYRPGTAAGGIDGVAVAIELLPDDFVPPNPAR